MSSEKTSIRLAWFLIFLICLAVLFLNGCAGPQKSNLDMCVINIKDNICWFDKSLGTGKSFKDLDGYFGVSPEDMTTILERVNSQGDGL